MALRSRTRATTLFLVGIASGLHASAAEPDDAQRAYATGQYGEARRIWTMLADKGDPVAELNLASLYDLGQGVAREPEAAFRWYHRAAEAGLPAAEFNVAVMQDTGDGVLRDTTEAAIWYARAAAHADARAEYNLGQLYADGEGVPRNIDQAKAWFRTAAHALPAAAARLAAMERDYPTHPPAGSDESGRVLPPRPIVPEDGVIISASGYRPGTTGTLELVWVAPAQTAPVRFFVEIVSLDDAKPHDVFSVYLDNTAALAPAEQVPGQYAWRVFAVSPKLRQYATSDWNRFLIQPSRR